MRGVHLLDCKDDSETNPGRLCKGRQIQLPDTLDNNLSTCCARSSVCSTADRRPCFDGKTETGTGSHRSVSALAQPEKLLREALRTSHHSRGRRGSSHQSSHTRNEIRPSASPTTAFVVGCIPSRRRISRRRGIRKCTTCYPSTNCKSWREAGTFLLDTECTQEQRCSHIN